MARQMHPAPAFAAGALALSVAACGHNPMGQSASYTWGPRHYASLSERDCMARAMYFESNRSSEEGMKAVGTVVMNRFKSGQYANNICGVVGAPRQFAPGVLSKPVSGASWALAQRSADAILRGERHARVGRAMHFHTAGYTFPYRNMAYVVAAGGNVFYEKKTPGSFTPVHPNVFVAEARNRPSRPSEAILLARAEEAAPAAPRTEPIRLAQLQERETPRAFRTPRTADPALAERDSEVLSPRERPKAERIRLAHLDSADMPKAMASRSDAAPIGGMTLSEKPKVLRGEPIRTAANAPATKVGPSAAKGAKADLGSERATMSHSAPAKAALSDGAFAKGAFGKPSNATGSRSAHAAASAPVASKAAVPAAGQLLAYKKPSPAADPAKLGWKKGPDAAASVSGKTKKRF